MSEAFNSTVNISFGVRGGLLVRQMHHWAADIFVGSIVVHMARIFFTGAFRKPRELNWIIGTLMLILAILEGFIGYSLPDDLISGTGLRIGYSIVESIPFVGSYLGTFLWGGQFPGNGSIDPALLHHPRPDHPARPVRAAGRPPRAVGAPEAHAVQGRGAHRDQRGGIADVPHLHGQDHRVPLHGGGATALLGAFAQINPIWQFGSYDPSKISYAVQPDWYMGWLDGALRIMPSWEFAGWGHTIPLEVLLPAVIFPGLIFNIAFVWPYLERRMTGDNELHNLLDRPRDRPKRTAAGAAMLALLFILFAASSTDVLANYFRLSLNFVLWAFRVLTFVVPIVVGFVTYGICKEMQGVRGIGKRKRAVVVHRSAEGEYTTVPTPPRPGDGPEELEAEPVPDRIDISPLAAPSLTASRESSPTGARQVSR